MNKTISHVLFAGTLLFLVYSCANKVSPTGGKQDVAPPVETSSSPPGFSVNFKAKEATITFDEFIQLKDLQKNIIVSPIMDPKPEVSVKRKSLVIRMPDNLRENTTYTMNFGEAIADIHEGNVARNFQYVFSTGPVLDSLEVKGNVLVAENLKTEKDILVMLYADSNWNDSTPYKYLPAYFAKTDTLGRFRITNISPGSYKIFAIKDADNNYLFNRTNEAIGFRFASLEVPDTNEAELRLFVEMPKLYLKKVAQVYQGKVVAAFSGPVKELHIQPFDNRPPVWEFIEQNDRKDTAIIWMKKDADSLQVIFADGINIVDTTWLKVKSDSKKRSEKDGGIKKLDIASSAQGGVLELSDSLFLSLSYPVMDYDLKKITVLQDSVKVESPEFLFSNDLKMRLKLNIPFKQGSKYDILIPSGTFTAYNGLVNDTTLFHFEPKDETEYGSITLNLTAPDIGFNYILLLVDDDDVVFRKVVVKPQSKTIFEFMDPGRYHAKIIYDGNANKQWDTGNYLDKLQPERVAYMKDPLTVRSNWDLETEWILTK